MAIGMNSRGKMVRPPGSRPPSPLPRTVEEREQTMNANEQHPELRDGETFLINATVAVFNRIKWKTKRMGQKAYGADSNLLAAALVLFPVFVQQSELDEAGNPVVS